VNPGPSTEPRGSRDAWILLATGLLALTPYLAYRALFNRLYWFGDEIDQVDLIDRLGFWHWTWLFYGENFAPVFKLLWGGCLFAFGGAYAPMVALVWLTHALNVVLLGRLMRACALPWSAVLPAQAVLGFTSATIETLAWSVQWSSVLSVTFALLALDVFLRRPDRFLPAAWSVASALSFSRGILTGPVLAFGTLIPAEGMAPGRPARRLACVLALIAPSLAVVAVMMLLGEGNHRHMAGHWGQAALFSLWYCCLNPAYHVFFVDSWGWRTVALLGIAKFSLVAWSLIRSRGRLRLLILLLVLYDLGYAVLLGVGRYHTGLLASMSSRYQYMSLVGILPAAGFWLSSQWTRLPAPAWARRLALGVVLVVASVAMCRQWRSDLDPFSTYRGSDSRRIFFEDPNPLPGSVPGYAALPIERAQALVAKYHLH
jgi:hypothetical protein